MPGRVMSSPPNDEPWHRRSNMVRINQNQSTRQLSPTVESVGFTLSEAVLKLTRCANLVAVHDPATRVSTVIAASLGTDRRLLGMTVDPDSVAGLACVGDMRPDPAHSRDLVGARADRRQRERRGVVLPLLHEDKSVGALVVFAPEDWIEEVMRGRLAELAREAGHAVGEVIAVHLSQRLGLIDAITGQPNRPGLERAMHESITERCSLVSFSVDQIMELKIDLGNGVLKQLAAILRSSLRDYDVPARVSGNEFALFLPDSPFDGAVLVADRVRTAVNESEFDLGGRRPMTCAFGVAAIPETVNAIDDLITAASEARVEARESGPNRIATLH